MPTCQTRCPVPSAIRDSRLHKEPVSYAAVAAKEGRPNREYPVVEVVPFDRE
jgi:hypothetical protein